MKCVIYLHTISIPLHTFQNLLVDTPNFMHVYARTLLHAVIINLKNETYWPLRKILTDKK